ncbi:MAG: SDR family NAD(P)-dependent oxidoreductase [Chloroflexota bacterium]|nr:SDR family NAD(P)-dependent oxidoreductase [Chloroflexota bacterium]MDE2908465.1 SDR family NAD(P)-dependent oxidoreductase [Chloroflexota bacterium]
MAGQVAVITGAGAGIGLGCARVLGAAGAAIAVWDIDEAAAESAVERLQAGGVEAKSYIADVSQASAVETTIADIVRAFGKIDILVNNAGTHDGKGIEEGDEADWNRIVDTNLKSVFLTSKAALPHLKSARGCIVNMGSMVGLVGQGRSGAYSASKGGIIALTKNLALDLAPYGIRVNCICPGWVETSLVNAWFALQPEEAEARAYVDSIHPLGRIAKAEEIGKAALFLASDLASFVTGVAVEVDGGVTLGY